MKKGVTVILLASLLLSCASCGAEEGPKETDTVVPDESEEESAETQYLDGLDYGGQTMRIFIGNLGGTGTYDYIVRPGLNGDIVNDAIYEKNLAVENLLNVKLEFPSVDYVHDTRKALYDAIRVSVMSDEKPYEIIMAAVYYTSSLLTEGLLGDLNTLPYIDFDNDWWSSNFVDKATIDGKTTLASGDISLGYIGGIYSIFYNKEMMEEYDIPDVVQTVKNGDWTIDVLHSCIKDVYQDVNGDGKNDQEDIYGFSIDDRTKLQGFLIASDVDVFENESGNYDYIFGSERAITLFDNMIDLITDQSCWTIPVLTNNYTTEFMHSMPFCRERSIFTLGYIRDMEALRDLSFEYGIIPYPKFDDAQKQFYSSSSAAMPSVSIPVTSENDEAVGAVIEALAYYGQEKTTPMYFDSALKYKYSEGGDNAEMLDLMRASAMLSFTDIFAAALGGPNDKFRETLWNKKGGVWASKAESLRKGSTQKLNALLESLRSDN